MKQVLIVDKDHVFTTTLSAILSREDYKVSIAKDGKEASGALASTVFDLVITDMIMPYANGFELVSNIRNNESALHIPVMVVSDVTNEQNIAHCMRAGADVYFTKPVNIPDLISGIKDLIRNQKNVAA